VAVIRPEFGDDRFTRVPNAWLRDPGCPPGPKAYLSYLLSHAAGYRCSTAQAARDMGVGRDTVSGWNRKLIERGYFLAVEQGRTDGRFGENDYTITSCTDRVPTVPANPAQLTLDDAGKPAVSGKPRTVEPGTENPNDRSTGEKITPPPNGGGADGEERHLRAVEGPSVNQRANVLTREHYDATRGMTPFAGVLQIVRRALDGGGYEDAAVRKALALLRETGKPVTLQTLHAALETPDSVTGRRYGRPPAGPYRDPAPDEYRGSL
jgi:hypothetical protein